MLLDTKLQDKTDWADVSGVPLQSRLQVVERCWGGAVYRDRWVRSGEDWGCIGAGM